MGERSLSLERINSKRPDDTHSLNTQDHASVSLLPRAASEEWILMGKAPRLRTPLDQSSFSAHSKVRITEVAPANGSILFDDLSWRMSLTAFSNKKAIGSDTNSKLTRRMRSYYKAQDELITAYENLQQESESAAEALRLSQERAYKITSILSKVSFAMNFLLLVGKTVAVALSSSISIISSLVDSVVDLLSGIIIWWTSSAMRRNNILLYPSGRKRLEPVTIVILSVVMSLASLQLGTESIQKIVAIANHSGSMPFFSTPTIVIAASTVVIKLVLFLGCYPYRHLSTSIQTLMLDHRNDTISNTVAIVCGYLGSQQFVQQTGNYNVLYIDPVGALIIGMYILVSWWQIGWGQIKLLTGHTAKPDFLSKLTWVCLNHHKSITHIDTVRAFHFGNNFLVEVDIVLPEDMSLGEAHNIGESLQQRLEKMEEVERAFVHLDFETTHRPEEEHKIVV